MDKLEQRIAALREELEQVEQPDRAAIWGGVQRKMGTPARRFYQHPSWRAVAASVAILLIASAGWWAHRLLYGYSEDITLTHLSPEWQKEIKYYQQLVNEKERTLHLENIDRDAFSEVLRELESLDSVQAEFRQDFRALPKDERTVQTLLRYYEQKIRILELLTKEIQIKQNEQERDTQRRS
ncbi:MAG: hypothetical protein ACK4TA_17955 [Saprospiraceae bacterium]